MHKYNAIILKFVFISRKYSFFLLFFLFSNFFIANAQQEDYGVGSWDVDSLGTHRAVVKVTDSSTEAVHAHIVWRRRDAHPEKKDIIVVDAQSGKRVKNVYRANINTTTGDIVFEPTSGSGTYYMYYMPYKMKGSNYPQVIYDKPEINADSVWLKENGLDDKDTDKIDFVTFETAKVDELQAVDEFNSFYPMEVVASDEEVTQLEKQHAQEPYLLFPEDRFHPIRMWDKLPYRWIKKGPGTSFKGVADRGEFYSFQVGLFADKQAVKNIHVQFSDLSSEDGKTKIPATNFSSFNTEGVSWQGKHFDKNISIAKGKVHPLWMGVQVPKSAKPGNYQGTVTIKPENTSARKVTLMLMVKNNVIKDAGDDIPSRMSRLRWLDSKIAQNDKVVKPFTPIKRVQNKLQILGRSVELGSDGLPQQISSYFTPEVTDIRKKRRKLLSSPLQFVVTDNKGKELTLKGNGIHYKKQHEGLYSWKSKGKIENLNFNIHGKLEADGFMHYEVVVEARQKIKVNDIRMEIPVVKASAKYMMGLGLKGGYRPKEHHWKWDQTRHQEGAWIGDVNIGFQYQLRDTNYVRPLNTNFYQSHPLNLPPSWYNDGRGGSDVVEENNETVLVKAYSGRRTLQKGEKLYFNFNLLLTPFKKVNTTQHWNNRYFHSYKPVDEIAKTGANVINIHHATAINPYINYPFLRAKKMKKYIDEAHKKDMKVKIYYTIRELSNHAAELYAFRSLGHEIYSSGDGGGYSWLQEHLDGDYITGWFVPKLKDAALIDKGMSRWSNYYIEGLNWLVQNVGIDGLYIDDLAFTRTTMKRARKVLERGSGTQLIDLHSADQYNERDGFENSALLYMEDFPYIDRLWFGEYFEYESDPAYWLTEVSGLPFGLMGEMLQDGGNPWRGMIYGMTAREPRVDNTQFWKLWDAFDIQDSKMIGYWSPNAPIKSGNDNVKATSYVRKGKKTLLILASWAKNTVSVTPQIDWKAIGVDPHEAVLEAPKIEVLQGASQYKAGQSILLEPGEGKMLIIREK